MAELGEASSSRFSTGDPTDGEKPVVVRVKRKASTSPLDALWLEINERSYKKPLLDFSSLSIEDGAEKASYSNTKKVLVQRIETINGSDATSDVLQSFLNLSTTRKQTGKVEERRSLLKNDKKHDQLRLASRQKHEDLAKNARFKQIWKSRRDGFGTTDDSLKEICHLYDVVRVDEQEMPEKYQEEEKVDMEDYAILCNCLPMIREYLPTAAEDIESYVQSHRFKEEYVYDLYTVDEGSSTFENESFLEYPSARVNFEDDFYDGPPLSDLDSNDSNAEDNPMYDYPDEESDEDDEDNDDDPRDILSNESGSQYEQEIGEADDED